MIQRIKNYLKKYHEANLWINQIHIREGKKSFQPETPAAITTAPYGNAFVQHPEVVFSREDVGHSHEETQKIQQLYKDLGEFSLAPSFM